MSAKRDPGRAAAERHGLLAANKWLILRRLSQFGFFLLFAVGPWFGWWIVKGTLASSMTLNILPLTDPLVLLQSLIARHKPEGLALIGAAIVLGTYLVVGGRLYCSWVCPLEPVTGAAAWLRRKLDLGKGIALKRKARGWALAMVLIVAGITGSVAWELVNPITTLHRGLLFGISWGMLSVAAIFLFDVFVAEHGWCGHLCPVGAFYGLLNRKAMLRVAAPGRARCDDCMDCYAVCPENQVISPALKGARASTTPVILSADCTACGRCIDVCPERVFSFTHRFDGRLDPEPAGSGTDPVPAKQTDKVA